MASRSKSLVIVESPAKAKTINRFLGADYVVKASMGHVRDLPETKLGVDIDHGFKPNYVIIKGKRKTVKALKEAASKAEAVYLAPDMDREGEAIAWHLATLIDKDGKKIRRVIFNEITEKAIKQAFANPTEIDMRKVNAQQARRILDRLVGYLVSPLLWRVVYRRTSAGRVQSVALRLICEREDEIAKFVPREYWTIEARFRSKAGQEFGAVLEKRDGKKVEIGDAAAAEEIAADVRKQTYRIARVERKRKRRNPKAPYITSTLQQDAARRLGFSARKTMLVAQELYEGVDLGEQERVGLITYMRTDSVRVADTAKQAARRFISQQFGEDYLPAKPHRFGKVKASQDAHEAIRPTNPERKPEDLEPYLTKDQLELYRLVWERFLASQMAPALFDVTTIEIEGGPYLFKTSGSVRVFDGYQRIYSEKEDKEVLLPGVEVDEEVSLEQVEPKRHETQPPPRYTEASLIKELEEKGIGRPSTYATIVSTILERNYVEKSKGSLIPTELGKTVLRILLTAFPDIFDVNFTARMEAELDKVESGDDDWLRVIRDFYEPFKKSLERANAMKADLRRSVEEMTDIKCDVCGSPMIKKWGRHGQFLACSAFPTCKNTKPLEEEHQVNAVCPECGGEMIIRTGRFGKFLACRRYPECKGTRPYTLGIKCPREGCDGEITERKTRKGRTFYGCQNYPKCDFATWDRPVAEPCPECSYPIMVVKTSKDRGSYLKCPSCGSEAKS